MRGLSLLLVFAIVLKTNAQEFPRKEYDLEKLAENIFPTQDLDIDYSILYENLAQILSNPIDLNAATDEQVRSLYILTEIQIANFLKYREEQGTILSEYELQAIDGFDDITIRRLIPFITIGTGDYSMKSLIKRIANEENKYLVLRYNRILEQKKGYQYDPSLTTNYQGSPDRWYVRFRAARSSDFSIGFTGEKDPGETIDWRPDKKKYGLDYTSFHLQVLNKGIVSNLTLGDYQAQFGQGLVLGGGFSVGKGAEPITTVRRANTGFIPYTSLNETGYFRGIAVSLKPTHKWNIHSFLSRIGNDGSVDVDSTLSFLTSLSSTGYHRTQSELDNRKIVIESNYGTVVNFKTRSFEIGSIFNRSHFSIPIIRNSTPYNQFYFQGSNNTNVGLYLNYTWNNFSFFGEGAQSLGKGSAIVTGAMASLSPQFDLALLYRHYEKDYHTLYGNAFSEGTAAQNEKGYYLGWKYQFNKQHALAGYSDLFQFPWLRYRSYAPSAGHEWLIRYTYQPNKEVFFYVQAREESKARNNTEGLNLYQIENGVKRNYWVNLDYELSQTISFKSRVQFSSYSIEDNHTAGFALIQDVNFNWRKFAISARYALFDTDDYDNRQYVYERDVWLAYSFPFYNGVGLRSYALLQYSLTRKMDIWLRWSRFKYVDRSTIGSGSETIEGNSMNDVKFQARIRF